VLRVQIDSVLRNLQTAVIVERLFLAGTKELRDGVVPVKAAKAGSPDFVRGTSTEQFLNYLGIQMDSRKAEGMKFRINLVTPDNGEKFVMEMSNATLTTLAGFQAKDTDLNITIDRRDLEDVMIGTSKLGEKVAAGKPRWKAIHSYLPNLARRWCSGTTGSGFCPVPRGAEDRSVLGRRSCCDTARELSEARTFMRRVVGIN
jgi:Alkyl sulfatase C-terminal